MPNVLESISRRFKKTSNGLNDDLKYLLSDWGPTGDFLESSGPYASSSRADADAGDVESTDSFSTNATVDDNPGPGRLIDKFIYQRLGRKIEKLIPSPAIPPSTETETTAFEGDSMISTSSFSTNATTDDNPGPGRLIDKHVYQFFGRKVERTIFRIRVNTLPPATIVRYVEMSFSAPFAYEYFRVLPLGKILADLDRNRVGSTIISGLKGLIRQSRSNSYNRCAAAVAALIRISELDKGHIMGSFFLAAIAQAKPIVHLETLANSLQDRHPEKKYYMFLSGLTQATVVLCARSRPSLEMAQSLRRRFLSTLDLSRYSSDDPFIPVADACTILAQAISCLQQTPDKYTLAERTGSNPSWEEIMELAFFLLVFLLQSILRLSRAKEELAPGANVLKLHIMVMSLFIQWIDRAANEAVALSSIMGDMQIMELRLAVRAPFLAIRDTDARVLFPRVLQQMETYPIVWAKLLPRKIQATITAETDDPPVLQSLVQSSKQRALRLLFSFDELERDAHILILKHSARQPTRASMSNKRLTNERVQRWFNGARRARLELYENDITTEFRAAFELRYPGNQNMDSAQRGKWGLYKQRCLKRHMWGQLLRSNLEWDWDVAGSLKLLFGLERQAQTGLLLR